MDLKQVVSDQYNEIDQLRAEVERLTVDAERWRALVGGARVRVLGSAGVVEPRSDGYAHIGVEFWTHHPSDNEPMAVDHLTKFADLARRVKAEKVRG